MANEILLVEDSDHKRVRVLELIRDVCPGVEIVEARSFNSGARAIDGVAFDLVIMDMSLPTYDRSATESGGKFRALGGRELARKIVRRGQKSKIIFFTQYDAFSGPDSHTLDSLRGLLSKECGDNFHSLIYYDSSSSSWRDQLISALA